MPLYFRDDSMDDLAQRLAKLTGAKSETKAVRAALLAQLEAATSRVPLLDRIEPILKRADALGPGDPDFDMKRFIDELWGDA